MAVAMLRGVIERLGLSRPFGARCDAGFHRGIFREHHVAAAHDEVDVHGAAGAESPHGRAQRLHAAGEADHEAHNTKTPGTAFGVEFWVLALPP